jgi:hypothetical protein
VNFTHDFNPGNGPAVSSVDSGNGFGARVFWTAAIPDSDVQVNAGSGRAEMHIRNLPELDYYSPEGFGDLASLGSTWQTGYFDSTVSIDVVWNGPATRRVNVKDAANGFAGTFNENQATVTWSATSASGFTFVSNPGDFSTSVPEVLGVNGVTAPLNFFAQVAQERNGVFFPGGSSSKPKVAFTTIIDSTITQPPAQSIRLEPSSSIAASLKDSAPTTHSGLSIGELAPATVSATRVDHGLFFASLSRSAVERLFSDLGHQDDGIPFG